MPLQCDICEGIRIVPMLLDVPTLRRNKFRDPRFMGTRRVNFLMGALHEPKGPVTPCAPIEVVAKSVHRGPTCSTTAGSFPRFAFKLWSFILPIKSVAFH